MPTSLNHLARMLPSLYSQLTAPLTAAQVQYQALAKKVQCLPYSLLDVTCKTWFSDFQAFQAGLQGLEKLLTRALQQGYEAAGPLTAKLHLLPVMPYPCSLMGRNLG